MHSFYKTIFSSLGSAHGSTNCKGTQRFPNFGDLVYCAQYQGDSSPHLNENPFQAFSELLLHDSERNRKTERQILSELFRVDTPHSILCLEKRPTFDLLYSLQTQLDCDNFWHKCC